MIMFVIVYMAFDDAAREQVLLSLLVAAVVVGIVWVAAAAAWSWSQRQYFVGERNGEVVIFRGINGDLPGLSLSTPYETTNVELDRLSDFDAGKVREGIDAEDLDDARTTVDNLAARQDPDSSGESSSTGAATPVGG
jgi:protein phosphatase